MKSIHEKRKKAGVCILCEEPVVEGKLRCARCLAYAVEATKKSQAKKKKAGLCVCGNTRVEGRPRCFRCLSYQTRWWEEKKKQLLAANLCLSCQREETRSGMKTCATCSAKRVQWYRKKLGVSGEEYARRREAQGGCCAICGKNPRSLCLDHDHSSGKVRDLLCHRCNRVLGLAEESPTLFQALAAYVERWAARGG